jgi:hypothetical protein
LERNGLDVDETTDYKDPINIIQKHRPTVWAKAINPRFNSRRQVTQKASTLYVGGKATPRFWLPRRKKQTVVTPTKLLQTGVIKGIRSLHLDIGFEQYKKPTQFQ